MFVINIIIKSIHISLLFFNNLDILKVRKPGRPTEYIYNVSILNNKQSDLVSNYKKNLIQMVNKFKA